MNDFDRDNQWQKQMRGAFLMPFYQHNYSGFVFFDEGRCAKLEQERGCDTLVWSDSYHPMSIEEKIVRCPEREPYTAICLETHSCTVPGHIRAGWMWTSKADILLYCFHTANDTLDCLWIDFPQLHDWFWQNEKQFALSIMANTINKTASRVVPIDAIAARVAVERFELTRELVA